MRTAVTGAAGHLGANLVRALLARGDTVRVLLHHDRRAVEGLEVEVFPGDLADMRSLAAAFDGMDVVYHTAGAISLQMDENDWLQAVNVEGVKNVVAACRAGGVKRLVHFSSIHALEQQPMDRPLDEERPLVNGNGARPYSLSKAAGERIVRQAVEEGLDAVILLPTGIIGPYDFKPSHFGDVLLALARGRMPALVDAGFDWVDARDVSAAAITAAGIAPAGSRYLVSGHWVSFPEIAAQVRELTGRRMPWLTVPLWVAQLSLPFGSFVRGSSGRPLFTEVTLDALHDNQHVSAARARRELGYHPRPFADTLADTLTWFRQNGWFKHE